MTSRSSRFILAVLLLIVCSAGAWAGDKVPGRRSGRSATLAAVEAATEAAASSPKADWLAAVPVAVRAAAPAAFTKGSQLEAVLLSPATVETTPGGIVTLSVRVGNHTASAARYEETLTLPEGWETVIPVSQIELGAGQTTARQVAVRVPGGIAAGRYDVAYSVRCVTDYAQIDTVSIGVVVLPLRKLTMLLENKPTLAVGGAAYEVSARLINYGNGPITVKLNAVSGNLYPVKLDVSEVTLEKGASRLIVATVITSKSFDARQDTLLLQALPSGGGAPLVSLSVPTKLLSSSTVVPDLNRRIPALLQLRASLMDGDSGVQGEFTGGGFLDEQLKRRVDWRFVTPDFGRDTITTRDEYWAAYQTPSYTVRLGDQYLRLSELTASHNYGRGLYAAYHPAGNPRDLKAGAYYTKSRWGNPSYTQTGAFVASDFSDKLSAQLTATSVATDAFTYRPETNDSQIALRARYIINKLNTVEGEYAFGRSDRDGGVTDGAYDLRFNGATRSQINYALRSTMGGPDYWGRWHDALTNSAFVSVPLDTGKSWRARASYNSHDRNLDENPLRGSAPRERLMQAGVTHYGTWAIGLQYEDYSNEDVLTPSSADWTERGVGLIGNRSWGRGDLRLELHHNKQTDNLALLSEWVTRGAFYATYRPNDRLFLGASANVGGQGPLAASRLLWQTNNASLSASWIPNNRWNMHANWQTSAFDQTDMDTGNMYSVGVLHTLPNDHLIELTASAYKYSNSGGDYNEAALTYTVPFGIPVGRRTDIGILGGRVTDEAGVGIGGAVLSIGNIQAMSAADGSYMFPELAPGSYTVSTTSLGENRVAEQRTLVAEVAAGRRAVLDVRVLPSATVVGLITVGGSGTEDLAVAGARRSVLAPNSPLVGLLVECSQGEETFRTLSDGDGKFIFENLGAGTWHVKIYDNAMPSGYYLEIKETDLVLETGKTAEFKVQALPRIRPIRMSDGSTTSPLAPMIAKASTAPTTPLVRRASTAPASPLIAPASTAPKTPVAAPNTQSAVSATTRPAPGTKTGITAITNRDRNPGTSVTVKPAAASSGKATSAAAAASKATATPVALAPAKPASAASASAIVQAAKAAAAAGGTSAPADVMNYDIVVAGTVVFRLTNRFNYRTLTERGGKVDRRLEQVVNDRWNTPAKAQASPRPDVWLIMGNGTVIIEVSKADAADAGAPSIASLAQDWANRLNKVLGRK